MAATTPLQSQQFRIALNITEPEGSTTITSQLGAALRGLGDVTVVTDDEAHDFLLTGVAICSPRVTCDAYAVALQFAQPFPEPAGGIVLSKLVGQAGTLSPAQDSVLKATLHEQTKSYYKRLQLWVATWPRASISTGVSQLISDIDQGCLERQRIFRRMTEAYVRRDTVTGNALSGKLYKRPLPDNVICV